MYGMDYFCNEWANKCTTFVSTYCN
jgi:hypothetical protein